MRTAFSARCCPPLRKAGRSAPALAGTSGADLPARQRRGVGREACPKTGFDPVHGAEVTAVRRRITAERELPLTTAARLR